MSDVGVTVNVLGMEAVESKLERMMSAAMKSALLQSNQKSANEFEALVRTAVPESGDAHGTPLANTLKQTAHGRYGVSVSIGDEGTHRYPMHLEQGHKMPDGSHVPGKPYWFPAKRVLKKRQGNRAARIYRSIAKGIAGG